MARTPDPTKIDSDDAPASHSGDLRTLYVAIGAGAVALIALAALLLVWAPWASDTPASDPGDDAVATDCAPLEAVVLELDSQVVQPSSPFCLVVTERVELTVGAAALEEGADLALSLETTDGGVLSGADTSAGTDPVVTVVVDPGAYVGYVTALDGSEAPPFLIYTATLAATDDDATTAEVRTPTLADCGVDVPLYTDDAVLDTDGTSPYLCLEVTETMFAVAGAESHAALSPDEGGPDLTLAIAEFDEDGVAQTLRSNDDAFGYDPEVTLDLEPGTYLVTASSWFGTEMGDLTLYAGPAEAHLRTSEVSAGIADVTAEVCETAPAMSVGDAITLEGAVTYVCLDNPSQQRLRIEAATLAEQDLALEIVQIVDGSPVRVAWADAAPEDTDLASTDPAIDRVLPEGTLIIAVTTFFDEGAADYDLRVTAVD